MTFSNPASGHTGFQRYQLGDELARGGMGRIVETVDNTMERTVAMKLLLGGKRTHRLAVAFRAGSSNYRPASASQHHTRL